MHRIRNCILRASVAGIVFGVGMLLVSCSGYAPPTAVTAASSGASDFRYPELTQELLAAGPAPGYRFLSAGGQPGALDDATCDSLSASRNCWEGQQRTVSIPLVSVHVPLGANPEATVLSVTAPNGCVAVADFYPHPYQFSGTVEIRWDLASLGLPDDFDYTRIVPWYVNDAGEYIPVEFELSADRRTLTVHTDHFSRYILGNAME